MKTKKHLMLATLAAGFILLSTANAKTIPATIGKSRLSLIAPGKLSKTFSKKMIFFDSINITCWFDTRVSTNWTVTIAGYEAGTSNYIYNTYTLDSNSPNAPVGKIPPGEYNIYFLCTDGDTNVEIDTSAGYGSNYYFCAKYIYSNSSGEVVGVEVPYNSSPWYQELHFDFYNYLD